MTVLHYILIIAVVAFVLTTGCVSPQPPQKTVAERLLQYGPAARARWLPLFAKAQVAYPPHQVWLAAFKQERRMEVYARDGLSNAFRRVATFPILGASGTLGPKLREGDRQVPEGIYAIELLNPNSRHEVSLKIGYPNAFDREQAVREGRTEPGTDIMIHGSDSSIGCLAMGDEVSADLFVLAADVGISNVTVVISPVDFREGKSAPLEGQPVWVGEVYRDLQSKLVELPKETP